MKYHFLLLMGNPGFRKVKELAGYQVATRWLYQLGVAIGILPHNQPLQKVTQTSIFTELTNTDASW